MFNFLKPKIAVATHNGSFHADDVFAVATLSIWAGQNRKRIKVMRTRDPEIINKADIVVDVGMEYDPSKNRFDHHQKGGAGEHITGIPYASFGLVWKHYGEKICSKEVAVEIEKDLVMPIDARDNGVNISKATELGVMDYRIANALFSFNNTWVEEEEKPRDRFEKALKFALEILKREIEWKKAEIEGARLTQEAVKAQNFPEILILERRLDSKEEVTKYKNIKFIASKSKDSDNWSIISARDDVEDYNSTRASLPETWRGLRDEELEKASGVKGAIFCHRGGWFAKAKTKEAAIEMAKKALV